ncbi:FtsW/RodA/SpoVE family cell cycle protein [Paenibacillus glycanilyticus]|uniref:FtsW/RodA/SpoVE family cell cycle protein n=1 Tax=Paenibacillus glycanilyticus TaxID=126569 RepID=UPI00203E1309|nr:FtsW/RodA/SpoVE family cell cycle protein [Paenibacillus glycanilyticus]MCM3625763.1 FtsW/RodA/SpoVE family cell cycle protein [Paenibacillus glycanilyticus]
MSGSGMEQRPVVQAFLERMCAQVRAKNVHEDIRLEMLDHLEAIVYEKMDGGMEENEAIEAAIGQMGDPDTVGRQLDATHKPKPEWIVIGLVVGMLGIGAVTLLSLYYAMDGQLSIERKMLFVLAGISVMGGLYFVNYQRLLDYSNFLYGGALAIMAAPHWQGVGVNGAKQWIYVGAFSLNVCAIAPYLLIAATAGMLHRDTLKRPVEGNDIERFKKLVKDIAVYMVVPSGFFIAAPALGNLLTYLVGVTVLLLMKGRWRFLLAACCSMGALVLILQSFYNQDLLLRLWERYSTFLDRSEMSSFHTLRSMEAIHDGGLWGQGFGIVTKRLPLITSEMTYSYLVYSLGWLFGIVIALLSLLFLFRIAKMGMRLQDGYAKGIVIGLTTVLGFQYAWSLLMSVGLMPILGGMQMPIMNWSSITLIELGAVGLMLGAYRRKDMLRRTDTQSVGI